MYQGPTSESQRGPFPQLFEGRIAQGYSCILAISPIEIGSNGTRFHPPNEFETPESLFTPGIPSTASIPSPRWLRRTDNCEGLVYADGACLGNGTDQARAGYAFVFGPPNPRQSPLQSGSRARNHTETSRPTTTKLRLELHGPQGTPELQTSNRAELRAVIAVMQFRAWWGEGIQRLVIATDSSYVVDCATQSIHAWQTNGWRTAKGPPVKNRDLWELYLAELQRCSNSGLHVLFWKIPREWNSTADAAAREAATLPDTEEYSKVLGVCC
ncbi:hypothetical protein PV10_08782 [Exophiala mesophila]|uniref:ribonuclease H n=1 Tax=Exophiala mesophila TaxID=212818 RepID=A0A0D1Z5M9_EXOME|nr:uncharacterized protein PV10_08782 [Exophiala mesophila]KIV89194.1 hypothetical protein PV10_08782 [Exophiala mesophila]